MYRVHKRVWRPLLGYRYAFSELTIICAFHTRKTPRFQQMYAHSWTVAMTVHSSLHCQAKGTGCVFSVQLLPQDVIFLFRKFTARFTFSLHPIFCPCASSYDVVQEPQPLQACIDLIKWKPISCTAVLKRRRNTHIRWNIGVRMNCSIRNHSLWGLH